MSVKRDMMPGVIRQLLVATALAHFEAVISESFLTSRAKCFGQQRTALTVAHKCPFPEATRESSLKFCADLAISVRTDLERPFLHWAIADR